MDFLEEAVDAKYLTVDRLAPFQQRNRSGGRTGSDDSRYWHCIGTGFFATEIS